MKTTTIVDSPSVDHTADDYPHTSAVRALLDVWFPNGIRRVLLVNPPDGTAELFRVPTATRRRYANFPPYGLGLLAQHLRQIGIAVDLINLNHLILKACHESTRHDDFPFDSIWQNALNERLADFKPDLALTTCMFTMTHTSLKRVCTHVAEAGVPVAAGGVHVTNDLNRVLDDIPGISIAFPNEGELALKQFCAVVSGDAEVDTLRQVTLSVDEQRYSFSGSLRPDGDDLNVIPAFDLMDSAVLSRYGVIGNYHGFRPRELPFATVLSNRGCRARCTFCSVRNFNGMRVRQRSVDSVLDELELLRHEYGIGHIMWLDDDLLKDSKRAIALFNGMIDRKLGLTWDATNGVIAASCTDEVVHAMSDSGCIGANIGMESGNPKILREIRKPGTVRNFIAAAETFRKYPKIHARAFLMIGFPGETLAMIGDTISVAREMDMDWYGTTVLQPLPNTPIYDAMVEQGLITPVGSLDTRFNSGGFGKQDEIDLGIRMATQGFEQAFSSMALDEVPAPERLTDIWFYMNYHLNFHRLFSENRPQKMAQQLQHLGTLCDVISPEHGLALYFIGYLQHRLGRTIEPDIISRLDVKLASSDYWQERFDAFGLAVDDLRNLNFRNKEIPRIVPGQVPNDDV